MEVFSAIDNAMFSGHSAEDFKPILDSIRHRNDYYILAKDF